MYLGGYELEEHAAEAYDVAALKCKGIKVKTNFPVQKYMELMSYLDTARALPPPAAAGRCTTLRLLAVCCLLCSSRGLKSDLLRPPAPSSPRERLDGCAFFPRRRCSR